MCAPCLAAAALPGHCALAASPLSPPALAAAHLRVRVAVVGGTASRAVHRARPRYEGASLATWRRERRAAAVPASLQGQQVGAHR